MTTIAITNQKGGSGKTTTSVNLAAALGELGQRVLLVDLDSQCSASEWLGAQTAEPGGAGETLDILDVLADGAPVEEAVIGSGFTGLELLPASPMLVGVEKALADEVGPETILRAALDKTTRTWDYVLFDCPPSLGLLSISALVAAEEVFVPVETSVMPLAGLAALKNTVDSARDRLNPALMLTGILPCRVDLRTRLAAEVLESLRSGFGDLVYRQHIRENVRIKESYSYGKPITYYDPHSNGAVDYRAAAGEFLERRDKQHSASEEAMI